MTSQSYDVVVVGGGVAGLSAACAAAENGARVAILERSTEAETGGNTRYTEAFLRMQSAESVADGLEETLVDDFMGHLDPSLMADAALDPQRRSPLYRAHHAVDPDYVAELAASAPETLAWMGTHGMRFDFLPTPFLTTSTTRMAPVGGGLAIVETMGKAARGLGVEFHFQTTARSLITGESGVEGVLAQTPSGPVEFTGQVVLASGGYQGNAELMARYHGERALTSRPVARGGNYNKGEGLEMALALGAATAGNFSLFHAEPVDPRSREAEAAIFCFPYGVLVNAEGRRFVDEARGPIDAWYERTTRDIQAQTRGTAWVIMDQQSLSVPNVRSGIRTDIAPVVADSIAALAVALEVPVGRARGDHRVVQRGLPRRGVRPQHARRAVDHRSGPGQVELGSPAERGPVRGLPDHGRERLHLRRPQDHARCRGGRPRRPGDPRAVGGRRAHRALLLQLHRLDVGAAGCDVRPDRGDRRGAVRARGSLT